MWAQKLHTPLQTFCLQGAVGQKKVALKGRGAGFRELVSELVSESTWLHEAQCKKKNNILNSDSYKTAVLE